MFDPLRQKTRVLVYSTVTFLLGVGIASGLGWTAPSFAMPRMETEPQLSRDQVQPALDLSDAFINIADAVTPAVVRIEVERRRTAAQSHSQIPDEFRRFFPDLPDPEDPGFALAGGSGFIISPDGYILTNDHVVSGSENIRVWLPDRRYFQAEVVGTDPSTDVAVIKIDAEGLPTLSFGNSDGVRVGEWILAVGNPGFGPRSQLDYTVTAGIVSARGRGLDLIRRELQRDPRYGRDGAGYAIEDFIQTDAVINPGNSGGPMVNLQGQVIGINSAIASQTGVWQGYGFAIPINLAHRIMEDLIEYGYARRPLLGVQIDDVDPEDAEYYGLPDVSGVLIQGVTADGPAAEAGLRQGDVIVSLNGRQVDRVPELQYRVAEMHPGDRVSVRYYRDGSIRTAEVRLDEAPISRPDREEPVRAAAAEERLGLQVGVLDARTARELGYEQAGGVIVTDVAPVGPAARRGILRGQRILAINDREVVEPEDVKEILEAIAGGEIASFLIYDPVNGERIVNVRVPR